LPLLTVTTQKTAPPQFSGRPFSPSSLQSKTVALSRRVQPPSVGEQSQSSRSAALVSWNHKEPTRPIT
ncbi:hypothetical protein LINPERPRIM_LOCUS23901, partial [Linum perenne]